MRDTTRTTNRQAGLTLAEVMIASAILSVVLLGVYLIWGQSSRSYQMSQVRASQQADARNAYARLVRELRQATYVSLSDNWAQSNGEAGQTRNAISFAYLTETGVEAVRYALVDNCAISPTGFCLERQPLTATPDAVVIGGVSRRYFIFSATGQRQLLAAGLLPTTGFQVRVVAPSPIPANQSSGGGSWIQGPIELQVSITLREPPSAGFTIPRDTQLTSTVIPRNF